MQEFITPPNHKGFSAKRLFDENGKIKWGAIAYIEKDGMIPHSIWNNIDQTTVVIKISTEREQSI